MADNKFFSNKKAIRNLAVAAGVLIIMIAAVVMLKYIPDNPLAEQTEGNVEYSTIYKCDYEKIVKISLENENGSNAFVKSDDEWLCETNSEIVVSSDKVLELIMSFGTVVGTLVEENAENLSDYGFDSPLAVIEIEHSDGAKQGFILGDATATGSGYYFKLSDGASVYVLASYKCNDFFLSLYDFRESNIFSPTSETINSISVENKNGSFKLTKYSANENSTTLFMSNWQLVSPNVLEGDDESIEKVFFSEMNLVTKEFLDDDSAYYSKYGFDSPNCITKYEDLDGNIKTLTFGKMTDGQIYLKIDGDDWVYLVSAADLSIIDVKYLDVSSSLAMLEKIDNIKSVYVFFDNKNHVMSIDRANGSELYKIDDINVEEDDFKALYQDIIGVTIEGDIDNPGSGQHLCSITFNYLEELESKTVDYYTYEDRYAAIIINGELNYYTSRDKVQKIIDSVMEIIN